MAVSKIVPKQFIEDFELVATHYNLKELGEYYQAKDAARSNLESAITTFAAIAKEIRDGTA